MTTRTATYLVGTPSGNVQKNEVTITAAATSGDGNGLKIANYRFDSVESTIFGKLKGNASMNLYVYPYPGNTSERHLVTTVSAGSDSYNVATSSFSEVLVGPFWAIEGEKVGASGTAFAITYI